MGLRTPFEFRADPVDDVRAPAGNPEGSPMRYIDVFYAAAFAILLGWLVLGSVIDAEHPGASLAGENTASSPPAESVSSPQPQPVATAMVDERSFWILVGGSSHLYSVAVSEDD
jgi:hypothetical protein